MANTWQVIIYAAIGISVVVAGILLVRKFSEEEEEEEKIFEEDIKVSNLKNSS